MTAAGKRVDSQELTKALKQKTTVLLFSEHETIDPFILAMFKPDTLILVLPTPSQQVSVAEKVVPVPVTGEGKLQGMPYTPLNQKYRSNTESSANLHDGGLVIRPPQQRRNPTAPKNMPPMDEVAVTKNHLTPSTSDRGACRWAGRRPCGHSQARSWRRRAVRRRCLPTRC